MLSNELVKKFNDIGLEIHYFKIGWYNDAVGDEYQLKYPYDTLAFVILSNPSWFEKAFLPFLARNIHLFINDGNDENSDELSNHNCLNCRDPIDQCMRYHFDLLSKDISTAMNVEIDKFHDFDMVMPYRRPRILLQTAAHISGAAYYYRLPNGTINKHKLGVCIHAEYGGWFGLRGVFILKDTYVPNLVRKPPPNIIPDLKEQIKLLELFNENWRDGKYRDFVPVKSRYSEIQFKYFQLEPRKRFEYIRKEIFPRLNELIAMNGMDSNKCYNDGDNNHHKNISNDN